MSQKLTTIAQTSLKQDMPELRTGDLVRVHQRIREKSSKGEAKERIQVFEGTVIAQKHGRGVQGTITVRGTVEGVGVERVFPVHSPMIQKIEVKTERKARRAKLYYLRDKTEKEIRRKLKSRTAKK